MGCDYDLHILGFIQYSTPCMILVLVYQCWEEVEQQKKVGKGGDGKESQYFRSTWLHHK